MKKLILILLLLISCKIFGQGSLYLGNEKVMTFYSGVPSVLDFKFPISINGVPVASGGGDAYLGNRNTFTKKNIFDSLFSSQNISMTNNYGLKWTASSIKSLSDAFYYKGLAHTFSTNYATSLMQIDSIIGLQMYKNIQFTNGANTWIKNTDNFKLFLGANNDTAIEILTSNDVRMHEGLDVDGSVNVSELNALNGITTLSGTVTGSDLQATNDCIVGNDLFVFGDSEVGTVINGRWTGSPIDTSYIDDNNLLRRATNLSDLNNKATARQNLGVDKLTTIADANYTVLTTDKVVGFKTITATRTLTLPAANAVNAGYEITLADFSGSVSTSIKLIINRAGTDTLQGTTSDTLTSAYGFRKLTSNGIGRWTYDGGLVRLNSTQTLTNKTLTSPIITGITRGYIPIGSYLLSPADGVTYFFGSHYATNPSTAEGRNKVYIPSACTITSITLDGYSTVAGTTENITYKIKKNGSAAATLTTAGQLTVTNGISHLLVTGLSISITAGDYIEFEMNSPTWATNPTTVYFNGLMEIQ